MPAFTKCRLGGVLPALLVLMVATPAAASSTALIESHRSVAAVVACFRATGEFATFAHLAHNPVSGSATYRLRFDRSLLEEVRFLPRDGGGTQIEITLSDDYTRRDRADFAAARGDVLARCARAPVRIAALAGADVAP